jgi:putative transposase
MRRGRFTEDQIIGVLREHEAGVKTADLCRQHGISDATFYNWKSKYGGMTVSEAARLRTLEDENRRLKKLVAESMLDVSALKDLLGKTDPSRIERPRPERKLATNISRLVAPLTIPIRKAASVPNAPTTMMAVPTISKALVARWIQPLSLVIMALHALTASAAQIAA